MAVTEWKFPQTAANVADDVGDSEWFNPDHILTDNETEYADALSGEKNPTGTQRLVATNFGFTSSDVPEGSTIDGVEVLIRGTVSGSGAGYATDEKVYLYNSGLIGDNQTLAGTFIQDSISSHTIGGAAEDWGATLTQTLIVSSAFGVAFTSIIEPSILDLYIYYIKMRVYYTEGGGGVLIPQPFWWIN